jgi:hypothetical protein
MKAVQEIAMPNLSDCRMLDLSNMESLTKILVLDILIGEPGINHHISLYRRNFIRLIDKAFIEYELARAVILDEIAEENRPTEEMIKTGRYIDLFGFTNHIENCINAIRRIYKLLDRIKTEKESPPIPREKRKLVESKGKSIANLRNIVEHIDELIFKDELAPRKPIMLAISKDGNGISISNYDLSFNDLSVLLKNIYAIGQSLLKTPSEQSIENAR